MMNNSIGLYIHVPFCRSKCPYCDFYSVLSSQEMMDRYTQEVCKRLSNQSYTFDTIYFGGGTPSQLGADRIFRILNCTNFTTDSEITIEANPSDLGAQNCKFDFELLKRSGVNRVSIGLQSADNVERKLLGRLAGENEVIKSIDRLKSVDIDNISLDLMLGIPKQNFESLQKSLEFCLSQDVKHISTYMLSIENGTYFYKNAAKYNFPNDDIVSEMYLKTIDYFENNGFIQYEISNFSKFGYESRHNLKYWKCEDYLGIGPAAHSFINGKRYYYKNDLNEFLNGAEPIFDCNGGDMQEYIMLALRLNKGLMFSDFTEKFGTDIPDYIFNNLKRVPSKYIVVTDKSISLTKEGFLLSNNVISELLLEN